MTANGSKECPNANNVGAGYVLAGGGANDAGSRPLPLVIAGRPATRRVPVSKGNRQAAFRLHPQRRRRRRPSCRVTCLT